MPPETSDELNYHEQLFISRMRTPSVSTYDGIDSTLRNADKYLRNLPHVQLDEIPEDNRECSICQQAYGTRKGEDEKIIVKSPQCGHKFDLLCIREWLSPTQIPNRNTCPMCRSVCFEIGHSGWSDDEMSEDEMTDRPLYDDAEDLLPELYALLDLDTFDAFLAAIMILEPYMAATLPLPQGLTYSRQVLALFQTYQKLTVPDSDDFTPDEAFMRDMVRKMAALMGQLYTRFESRLGVARAMIPWGGEGPGYRALIDQRTCGTIEHLVSVEGPYGHRGRRNSVSY